LSAGAVAHASDFSWDRTAEGLLHVYRDAVTEHRTLIAKRLEEYAW
jgi:D-inositol-3-phosphate glycosyltransferase